MFLSSHVDLLALEALGGPPVETAQGEIERLTEEVGGWEGRLRAILGDAFVDAVATLEAWARIRDMDTEDPSVLVVQAQLRSEADAAEELVRKFALDVHGVWANRLPIGAVFGGAWLDGQLELRGLRIADAFRLIASQIRDGSCQFDIVGDALSRQRHASVRESAARLWEQAANVREDADARRSLCAVDLGFPCATIDGIWVEAGPAMRDLDDAAAWALEQAFYPTEDD